MALEPIPRLIIAAENTIVQSTHMLLFAHFPMTAEPGRGRKDNEFFEKKAIPLERPVNPFNSDLVSVLWKAYLVD